MSYQICPVCKGCGQDQFWINSTSAKNPPPCRICQGRGIIHIDTGNPPKEIEKDEQDKN